MPNKINFKNQFQDMAAILEKDGIKVSCNYNVNNESYPSLSLVCVNASQTWENRYYTLLHEAGHVYIYR